MGTNQFRWLPSLRELSDEQRRVIDDPLTDDSLIYGPAGSGKTGVTLYRAKTLNDSGKQVRIFVYTHALKQFIHAAALDLGLDLSRIETFYVWARRMYKNHVGDPNRVQGDNKFSLWVDGLVGHFKQHPERIERAEYVLIDEAQDFPPNVAQLLRLVAKNVFVAGDTAQSIYENHTNLGEFATAWRPFKRENRLIRNYRNPKKVAQVAAVFLNASPIDRDKFVELVQGQTSEMQPVWYEAASDEAQIEQIVQILRQSRGSDSIGLLFRHKWHRDAVARALKARGIGHRVVEGADTPDNHFQDLATPTLITIHSAKGLEFDWVILPYLTADAWTEPAEDAKARRIFFVALTRTKNRLYLITRRGQECAPMKELISNHANLLQRPGAPSARPSSAGGTTFGKDVRIGIDDDSPF